MVLSSILTKALKLTLALMVAAPLVMATDAHAQRKKRSRPAPKPANVEPWQKALDKYYRPANPQSELDKAKSSLYRDPGKAIGLPSNAIKRPHAPAAPVVAPVTLDPAVSFLDNDGDGSISRSEYFQGRSRLSAPGVRANRFGQRQTQRLGSQFRRTDLNRDGKVTPDELQLRGTGRF